MKNIIIFYNVMKSQDINQYLKRKLVNKIKFKFN